MDIERNETIDSRSVNSAVSLERPFKKVLYIYIFLKTHIATSRGYFGHISKPRNDRIAERSTTLREGLYMLADRLLFQLGLSLVTGNIVTGKILNGPATNIYNYKIGCTHTHTRE